MTAYCTLEEVRRECRNNSPELTDRFVACALQASRIVDEYCGRNFLFHDHTTTPLSVKRSWVIEDTINLPFPVVELDRLKIYYSIKEKNSTQFWDGEAHFENGHRGNSSIYSGNGVFSPYPFTGFLDLYGKFGYAIPEGAETSPSIPKTISKATAVIAATLSMERRLEQVSIEGSRIELLDLEIPSYVYKSLDGFKDYSYMI